MGTVSLAEFDTLSSFVRGCERVFVWNTVMIGRQFLPLPMTSQFKQLQATVLVVEDSPEIQRYFRLLLQLDGYQVDTVASGEEALLRVRKGCAASVVLLDLQMPGIGGMETLRILRELRPELKIIMCSGVDHPETIREALGRGAQAYLVKPVHHLYLSAAVERCLVSDSTDQLPPASRVVAWPTVAPLAN
jgi:CheY-like chemotaxis protein